jgi:soluble lytic murein transglycosylase-like protein
LRVDKNKNRPALTCAGAILCGVLLLCSGSAAHATLYVYRAPDGSRLVTDTRMSEKGYRLLHRSDIVEGVGAVAAGRVPAHRVRPVKHSAYDKLIRKVARSYSLDPALVKAVVHAESSFDPYAISRRGAQGLMQLMPETAQHYGVANPFDPEQNVTGGTHYLKDLMKRFNFNAGLALAAYNAGADAVERHRGIPPYSETRNYVRKVQWLHSRYAGKYY